MPRPVVAVSALLGALILAGLAVLSAADRLGVPAASWMGIAAYRLQVQQALRGGDGAAAVAAARHVVARAPIDNGSASLLGTALTVARQDAAADAAFRVAGQLGWRDPITQVYWAAQTAGGPDYAVAAQRLDAALRSGLAIEPVSQSLRTLEASPGGRVAMAERLLLTPPWLRIYLDELDALPPPAAANRTQTVLAAHGGGLAVPEPLATRIALSWTLRGNGKAAIDAWTGLMGRGALDRTGLWDDDFGRIDDQGIPSPFRWRSQSSGSYQVSRRAAAGPPGGMLLVVQAFGANQERIAQQSIVLAPGAYRLDWSSGGEDGGPASDLQLGVECRFGVPVRQGAITVAGRIRSRTFEVPATGCPVQTVVMLDVPPESGPRPAAWIGGIHIRPASDSVQ